MEAAGSLIAGLIATYFSTKHLFPFEIALAIIILGFASSLWILWSLHRKLNRFIFILSCLIPVVLFLWIFGGARWLHKTSLQMQWQSYTIRDYHNTPYGNIVMLQRMEQTDILLNGTPIAHMPTPDIIRTEETAHLALLSHHEPKDILLLGNGLDGVIPEILKHPVRHLDYVEPDVKLVQQIRQLWPGKSITSADARLRIRHFDGREYLNVSDKKYDVIILNFSEPATLLLNRFYTLDFFHLCQRRLNAGGNLVFQIPSGATYINHELLQQNVSLLQTARQVFSDIFVIPDESATVILSNNKLKLSQPQVWSEKFKKNDIKTDFISQAYFEIKLDSLKVEWYQKQIQNVNGKTNTDLHPAAVWHSISYWIAVNEPRLLPVINLIENLNAGYLQISIILLIFIVIIVLKRSRLRSNSILYIPILTTGFTGMSLSILFVLLFQSCYGYIYHWLGYLVAAFMCGLSLGTTYFGTTVRKNTYHLLIIVELSFVFFLSLILILINQQFHLNFTQSYKYLILLYAIIGGLLVGAEFPLASVLKAGTSSALANSASGIYAIDLFGACLGGILTSVIFIPVFGITETVFILLLLKAGSICILIFLRSKINYNKY
jgi:spermidine synthase